MFDERCISNMMTPFDDAFRHDVAAGEHAGPR